MLTLTSPADTVLHRIPAGPKLALLVAATITVVHLDDPLLLAGILAGIAAAYRSFGAIFFKHGLVLLKPLLPFAAIVGLWHGWTDDLAGGVAIVLRFTIVVAVANLVTMTTRLAEIVALVQMLTPTIRSIGLSPRELALAIALAIRFMPVLAQKLEQIGMAFRARSTRRPRWRVFVPAILAVLDDADHVADALRARGGVDPMRIHSGE